MIDFDEDLDTEIDDIEYEDALRRADDEYQRSRCVLGAECLHPDPFHTSAECFDVEMAEAFMSDAVEGQR